jgi:DNA-binding NtrC family response regulator
MIISMGNPLILIVSNKDNRVSRFSTWLNQYDLTYADTAEEAINIFSNNYLKIRVVLLDLVLPDYSGIEVLIKMKALSKLSEIVIVSDQFDIQRAVDCIKKGAFDYLLFPFSQHKLIQTISQAIENIDYLSYETFEINHVDKEVQDRISFLNELVIKKRLSERSLTRQEMFELVSMKKGTLSDIQEHAISMVEKNFHSFKLPKVLLVEDEDLYRNLIKAFLHQSFDVIIAANGKEARERINEEENIDVVILDLFLPDESGVDLIPVIQEKQPDSEIVIVTAYEQISEATKLIRLGADNFLNKPILKDHLMKVVFDSMERKYKEKIIPYVKKRLIEHELSDEDKYKLLQDLIKSRKKNNKPVLMKDLYQYFPELRQLFLPDTLSVSGIDLQKGIEGFVHELKDGLTQESAFVSIEG